VFEAWVVGEVGGDWVGAVEVRVVAQGFDVCIGTVCLGFHVVDWVMCRPELFDEYTRRQYVAKARTRNPFGEEEGPKKFAEFDIFLKLRVLHQLSVWTLYNPDKIRERMVGSEEGDQTSWVWTMVPSSWMSLT
jgi:hypothetical protein